MSTSATIRKYREGDESGIISLLDLVFKGWPSFDIPSSNMEYWRWKYRDNHFSNVIVFVAEHEGKIVGHYPEIYHAIKIGQETVSGGIGTDVAIHPDFRNQGLWSKMSDLFKEELSKNETHFLYYLTGNPIVIKRMSRVRPKLPYSLSNLVCIKDLNKHLKAMPMERELLTKAGFTVVSGFNTVSKALKKSYSGKASFEVDEVDRFDDSLDIFWEEVSPHYLFIGKRDQEYLNFRYFDQRGGIFKVYQARNGDEILGYIVLRINRYNKGYPIGFVMDLLTLPHRLDVADALVRKAMKYFDDEGVNIVNYLQVKRHPYGRIFNNYNFVDCMVKFNVFYNFSGADILKTEGSIPPSKMLFSWGDHDSLPSSIKRE